ncbi:MAG: hypothetical protein K6G50_13490 [bacterium]|nr:hypothetical protein [bacterium]
MSSEKQIDRLFVLKVCVAALLMLSISEAVLLLSMTRGVSMLPLMARTGVSEKEAAVKELTLAQYIEGISRLDGLPELLLDKNQAMRLVPMVPLMRQALDDGMTEKGDAIDNMAVMLKKYIRETLTEQQLNHIYGMEAKGELEAEPSRVIERLPLFDRLLKQRVGIYLDTTGNSRTPVRRNLDKIRLYDLILGMLLLEANPDERLTLDQVKLLLPMQDLFTRVLRHTPGEIAESSVPVVEAQVREILTDEQQIALLKIIQENFISTLEVNEVELISQLGTLFAARVSGEVFVFRLNSLTVPTDTAREGPSVITSKSELELLTAIRGIILQLETDDALRLTDKQVDEISIISPAIINCLVNLFNGTKDLSLPDLQGRVSRILTRPQINYILDHQSDPVKALEYGPGEEPMSKELTRFLEARKHRLPYRPKYMDKAMPAGLKIVVPKAVLPQGDTALPGSESSSQSNANSSGGMESEQKASEGEILLPPEAGGSKVTSPAKNDEISAANNISSSDAAKMAPPSNSSMNVIIQPTPGIKPDPITPAEIPIVIIQQTPGVKPPPRNPVKYPIEALVRGILFSLEKDSEVRLKLAQVMKINENLDKYKKAIEQVELKPDSRDEYILNLTKDLYSVLSQKQKDYLAMHEKDARVGLKPAKSGSALVRELDRFVKARLNGKEYKPLLNEETEEQ